MSKGAKTIVAALACVALTPLCAQQPELTEEALATQLVDAAAWQFTSRRQKEDGNPECIETWVFLSDGRNLVQSGSEKVEHIWRIERSEAGYLQLTTVRQSSSGGKDCTGNENTPAGPSEEPFSFAILTEAETGTLHTCMWPEIIARKNPKFGDLSSEAACFGQISPNKDRA